MDGQVVEVQAGNLLKTPLAVDFLPGLNLIGFPNRDSLVYAQLYGLDNPSTLLRGTLRYSGFGEAMDALLSLGLIDPKPHPAFDPNSGPEVTWVYGISERIIGFMLQMHCLQKELICAMLNLRSDTFVETFKSKIAEKFGGPHSVQYKTLRE